MTVLATTVFLPAGAVAAAVLPLLLASAFWRVAGNLGSFVSSLCLGLLRLV